MDWHAINTKPHQEHVADMNLLRMGVETFYPRLRQHKLVRGIRRCVIGPLFPNYLFAKFDFVDQQRAVGFARGVRKIVAFGSTPAIVEVELIHAIRSKLQDGFATVAGRSLNPGDVVRIQEGPFCGIEAVFEREMSDRQRAVLLLRALAYQARVIVPIEHVANL